jgi:hypothetical protein
MSHCADEGIEYSGCGAEINENTPLLGGRDASIGVVGATLKSSCARRDEESALCGSLLADKQSPRDLSSGIAGVISILLLGMLVCSSRTITSSALLSSNSLFCPILFHFIPVLPHFSASSPPSNNPPHSSLPLPPVLKALPNHTFHL